MGNPISRELFLERARFRFGNQYDYAEIIYKSYKTPVRIRCTSHPVKQISITPEKHLQTTGGCKYCLREMRIASLERELNRAQPRQQGASQSAGTATYPTAGPAAYPAAGAPARPHIP